MLYFSLPLLVVLGAKLTGSSVFTLAHVLTHQIILLVEMTLSVREKASNLTFAVISVQVVWLAHGLVKEITASTTTSEGSSMI